MSYDNKNVLLRDLNDKSSSCDMSQVLPLRRILGQKSSHL
jgi:hypothetical protein